jgi:MoxR-like ATPase
MRKLNEFVDAYITEARPRKNADAAVGKDAEKNGSGGQWGINEPVDNEPVEPLDKEQLNKNMKRLLMKFKAEEPFFIIGQAGWGKTSIIKDMAKRFKREVVTVYLDKAAKEDLGGIPVPVQGKDGNAEQQMALPQWAAYMKNNPDKQFLLFFDEMNQAAPDVMNALMPIVLETEIAGIKFNNFFVGAAGNFEHENDAVSELSGPLKSRFKPLIVWETGGEAWTQAFSHLHKQWDEKLGKQLVDLFERNAEMFDNPREVEHKIFAFLYKLKQSGDNDMFDAEDYLERLENLAKTDLSRTQQTELKNLADQVYNFMIGKQEEQGKGSRSRKGQDMVSDSLKNLITQGVRRGYISQQENGKDVRYGISRENIAMVFCDDEYNTDALNAEMLERIIDKLEADGIKFKYETNADFKKAGLKDPSEE